MWRSSQAQRGVEGETVAAVVLVGGGMGEGHENNEARGGNEANYGNTMFKAMETMEAQVPMKR